MQELGGPASHASHGRAGFGDGDEVVVDLWPLRTTGDQTWPAARVLVRPVHLSAPSAASLFLLSPPLLSSIFSSLVFSSPTHSFRVCTK